MVDVLSEGSFRPPTEKKQDRLSEVITPEKLRQEHAPSHLWVYTKKYGETVSTLKPGFNREVETYKDTYTIDLPDQAREICEEIYGLGGATLLVGGCVRDAVLSNEIEGVNIKPKDFDLEVYGISPETLQRILETKFGKVDAVGRAFGVLKVNIGDMAEPTDISIPRRDSKTGSGHKGFHVEGDPTMTIREAALRRDLTMNSLAYDPLTNTVYDAHGGVEDIKQRIIEITDEQAFQEDPLRVLRVMQFAARFGFTVSEKTTALCRTMVERGDLDELPNERITEEVKKLMTKGRKPSLGLSFAREIGVTERYWPEMHAMIGVEQEQKWHPEGDVWTHTLQVVDAAAAIAEREELSEHDRLVVTLGALCHDFGKATTTVNVDGVWKAHGHEAAGVEPAQTFLKRFALPEKVQQQVLALIPDHLQPRELYTHERQGKNMNRALNRLALRLAKGDASLYQLALLVEADQRGRNGEGSEPLALDQVADLAEWRTWLLEKTKTLKIQDTAPERIVSGKDLMQQLGLTKGDVWFGAVLNAVYQDQLDGIVNSRDEALSRLSFYAGEMRSRVRQEVASNGNGHTERSVWERIAKSEDPRLYVNGGNGSHDTSHVVEQREPSEHQAVANNGGEPNGASDEVKYAARLKLFGERAQRVTKEEYPTVIGEIMAKAQGRFTTVAPVEQLSDKESFGDLDIVCLPEGKTDKVFFEDIYGVALQEYHRNGNIHSLLLQVAGKSVQVDFIRAEDETDYKRKMMYYSKGHLSSIIGVLSKQFNFKYGTEGFFKRFQDNKGNWHDVLISGDLTDGLRMLGLDPKMWSEIQTVEDIIDFVASSPYFDSKDYQTENLLRRDREQQQRISTQRYIMEKLARKQQTRTQTDGDAIFREQFPEVHQQYQQRAEEINREIERRRSIDGSLVMQTFGLKPGPDVGKVLRYLKEQYPDITELADNVIQHVKTDVLGTS